MEVLPEKIHLDWNRPLLQQATDWLLKEFAANLENVVVVVQGGRAVRRLEQLLAQQARQNGQILVPPRITTLSGAVSALFAPRNPIKPPAHPAVMQFAWALALDQVASEQLIGNRASDCFSSSRLAVAETLRSVCTEIRGHALWPEQVAPVVQQLNGSEKTADQWKAIQDTYSSYLRILDSLGFSDPVERRIALLENGIPIPSMHLVLAGVPQLDRIYSEGFRRITESASVLVFAPESEGHKFGPWGEVNEKWHSDPLPFQESHVLPAADSESQAILVSQWMKANKTGGPAQPQCILIAPDESEIPGLCDTLEEEGFSGRPAYWKKFSQTRPWQVLRLVADFLDRTPATPPSFESVAAMVRHPDFSRLIEAGAAISSLDRLHQNHLPAVFSPESYRENPKQPGQQKTLLALAESIALGFGPEKRPVSEIAKCTAALLLRIYQDERVDDNLLEGRLLRLPLEFLMEALEECRALSDVIRPTDFIRALLGSGGSSPVPYRAEPGAISIIGWLELLADDAPFAAVTSFSEGLIPDSVTADPFLPATLRTRLNLGSNESRLARDAYVATAAAQSRNGRLLVCALQRNVNGDPLRPSRLLFQGLKGKALAERMLKVVSHNGAKKSVPTQASTLRLPEPARVLIPRNKLSVTNFKSYLSSPRHFYYSNLLGLELPTDHAKEIDNGLAGTLLHNVFDAFGKETAIRDSADPRSIEIWLLKAFDQLWKNQFADLEMATVSIQRDMFEAKLAAFAKEQARQAAEGWRILATEIQLGRTLDFRDHSGAPATVEVSGKIDRIDHNPEKNQWRIVDYKTGNAKTPKERHLSGVKSTNLAGWEFALTNDQMKRWTDLQFPLYRWLLDGEPQLEAIQWQPNTPAEQFYFLLPDDIEEIAISEAFPADMLDEGLEMARKVAGNILSGYFPESPASLSFEDPIMRTLCGVSSVLGDNGEESE